MGAPAGRIELREISTRLRGIRISEDQIYLVLALVIGAFVGLVIVAFILITENLGAQMYPPTGSAWRRFLLPVIGSLVTGYLLFRFFPAARGSGIPQTKVAMMLGGGHISTRTVIGRFICSSGALASGIALGREGPSVQIGGGIASVLGRKLGLGPARLKGLIPVGGAAAVSAAFNTPIGGVLFALEEIMGDLHAPVLGSAVISSATAWVVLHLLLGNEPLFHVPGYELIHPAEFAVYAILGVLGGICSVAFVKLTLALRSRFKRLPRSTGWAHPLAGGLFVGIIAIWIPQVLGVGYDYVGQVLNGEITLRFVATLLVIKLVAVAMCYASGNTGGIFGPSLFLGAMLGGTVGTIAHTALPGLTASPGAYALVGMGAMFAGIVRVPMTSVFMIFELTRDYAIVVPLMIANMASFAISRRFQRIPVYEAFAMQDGVHLPRRVRDRVEGQGLDVIDVMSSRYAIVRPDTVLSQLPSGVEAWVVVDQDTVLGAVVSDDSIAEAAASTGQTVGDLLPSNGMIHAHPDHAVEDALEQMQDAESTAMVVLERGENPAIAGVVTERRILEAFGVKGA